MYKKILVPLDGSVRAEAALPQACALAKVLGARIILVNVLSDPIFEMLFTGLKLASATHEIVTTLRPQAKAYLRRVARTLRGGGYQVTTTVCEGVTAECILDCAKKRHADLIVVSAQGRGGGEGSWLGNVAASIVRESRVPVLLIRPNDIPTATC